MKLNKKYCALIDSDSGYDNKLLADCCEKVADEFAIGFGEYLDSLTAQDMGILSVKELLEIYKKEKGL